MQWINSSYLFISQVFITDYAKETKEEQLKWIRDMNARAYITEPKTVSKVTASQDHAGPSTSSTFAAMPTASTALEFEKSVVKGKKNVGKHNEKESRGTKMKKRGGKKKNHN